MHKRIFLWMLMAAVCLLTACQIQTVDQMYCLPKRPEAYNDLQQAIDEAMVGLEYSAPRTGENQQTVQMADLDGDGIREYFVFARSKDDKSLKILVFKEENETYLLSDILACTGNTFDRVAYAQLDGMGGLEMVVGCQLSGQVPRSVNVYTVSQNQIQLVLTTNYTEFLTCDLDENGANELMTLSSGTSESENGVAVLYSLANGTMERSNEVPLSGPVDKLRRIILGDLHGGMPAVFVGSTVDESAIITDVYTLIHGTLTNVSLSSESGTSVQTLRNHYVYADDIDSDGEVEMPSLITMKPLNENTPDGEQHLIRWYSMSVDGSTTDKLFTYHNYVGGWYLELDAQWAPQISVVQRDHSYEFYLWDAQQQDAKKMFTVYALTGHDREEQAVIGNRFVLHKSETVVYAAHMEVASGLLEISRDDLIAGFRLIRQDWKTGEM